MDIEKFSNDIDLTDIYEAARDNGIVNMALHFVIRDGYPFDKAMMNCVIILARQNKKLVQLLEDALRRVPSYYFTSDMREFLKDRQK